MKNFPESSASTSSLLNPGDEDAQESGCTINSIEPRDRFRFTYLSFYFLGILTLLPWNFFVTANDYWMYKFRDLTVNRSDTSRSELQSLFTSYVSMAATGPSVLFLLANSLFGSRVSIQLRIISSMVLIFLSFLMTTTLTMINTDKWQLIFFGITLITVVIVNVCSALLQAGLWSLSSKFPSSYTAAIISGQALGGIFTATVYILSLLADASSTVSALLYFNIANLAIVFSFFSYCYTTKTAFFKYHTIIKNFGNVLQYDPSDDDVIIVKPDFITWRQWKDVLNKVKLNGMCVFLCFSVTLAVYPSLTVLIVPIGQENKWRDVFFVPVISFLIFNIWDYLGRLSAAYAKSVFGNLCFIMVFSGTRAILIPLILLCNLQLKHLTPVIFENDLYFVFFVSMLGFSNGFIINTVFINVRRNIPESSDQETAFSIMAIFVGAGCAFGSVSSFMLIELV